MNALLMGRLDVVVLLMALITFSRLTSIPATTFVAITDITRPSCLLQTCET